MTGTLLVWDYTDPVLLAELVVFAEFVMKPQKPRLEAAAVDRYP